MTLENCGKRVARTFNGPFIIRVRAAAAAMFLCALFSSTVQARSDYSDLWVVGNSPNAYMAGIGVSDESYSGYNHTYNIISTITSPNGRTAVGYGGNGGCSHSGSPECGQANVSMLITANGEWELGDYFIESQHQTFCEYRNMELQEVFTGILSSVSLKKTAFRSVNNGVICFYNATCSGTCNPTGTAYSARRVGEGPCPAPYVQCNELYVGGICYQDTRVCLAQIEEGECE